MSNRPVVLTFSGNDSAGFAGMPMDIRTQSVMGVHSAAVITANTAQNNQQVVSINPVSGQVFEDQISANRQLPIASIKVGLLAAPEQIFAIQEIATANEIPLVLDPIFKSSSGSGFSSRSLIETLKAELFPSCTLLTPNIDEAEILTGLSITCFDDIVSAAEQMLAMGVKAVLIKGGHFGDQSVEVDAEFDVDNDIQAAHDADNNSVTQSCIQDYFSDGEKSFWLASEKINTKNLRGTGCALSSAIASALALKYSLYDAVVIGKMAVSQGLRHSYGLRHTEHGKIDHEIESGPICVQAFPHEQIDLPILGQSPFTSFLREPFPECNHPLLGLYPVVDRAEWIKTLAPAGITTIQLRVKDLAGQALEQEIRSAVKFAEEHNIRLFINDYWRLAIQCRAYGVHLGQEDLESADIEQIKQAGLRLGLSTHCHYEVAQAHAYCPSYMACGPVYHTTTKDMPWVPHGVEGLCYWQQVLDYPLVAVGGINQQRFDGIAATGVDSVAMITAITLAEKPIAVAQDFAERFQRAQ